MSKFAVRGFSETLQSELSDTKISVTVVFPGGVKTNIIKNAPDLKEDEKETAHSNFTKNAMIPADEAARRIIRAVQRKQKRRTIGPDARVVFAIRNLFPNSFPAILYAVFGKITFK